MADIIIPLRALGCDGQKSSFRGCRVGGEIIREHLLLKILAGSIPGRASEDEPAQFMISRTGLDELIDDLKSIRAKVAEAELAQAPRTHNRREFHHG